MDRPTFSESWYRVASLKPRLRSVTQIYRQHYRGQMWYVVRDASNNQFFRINDAAYYFLGLLDGRRTVADVWDMCNEILGERAPTQGEAIQLLGQLYTANLLQADLPADAEGMFERYRKRIRKEIGGYMMNLLFPRVPIWDPEPFLNRWHKGVSWVFGPVGVALWTLLLLAGVYFAIQRWDDLFSSAQGILDQDPGHLALLYVCFAFVKFFHEMGHAFSCKRFGTMTNAGGGGEVHTVGIMLLVFTPVPYVDASSAWAFRSKWHRIFVALGGMYVELAIASIAAIYWYFTSSPIAFNIIFVASIATILFNANPLLRFDGYYVLSDLLEIPNLAQRGKQYLYYLVKKYCFGVRQARDPGHSRSERAWLLTYAITSFIYRVFISVAIILFIADKLFFLGMLMAVGAIVGWVGVPIWKFIHYLTTSPELIRTRGRAMVWTTGFIGAVIVLVGVIPFPDRDRAQGVVEPRDFAFVHVDTDGFVNDYLASGQRIDAGGEPLIRATNQELETELRMLEADYRRTRMSLRQARTEELANANSLEQRLNVIARNIERIEERTDKLNLRPSIAGTWVAPDIETVKGRFLPRGEKVGMIVSDDDLIVRATPTQNVGPRVKYHVDRGDRVIVEMRVRGQPDIHLTGEVAYIDNAGKRQLPSAALGYRVGGALAVDPTDPEGRRTIESFFEVHIDPDKADEHYHALRSGQTLVVRFEMPDKPLGVQWWRAIRQMIQKRYLQ